MRMPMQRHIHRIYTYMYIYIYQLSGATCPHVHSHASPTPQPKMNSLISPIPQSIVQQMNTDCDLTRGLDH